MQDICFIGDGIVMGFGDEAFSGWPGRLAVLESARGRHVRPFNLGVAFDTSEGVRRRWRAEAGARLQGAEQAGLVFSFGLCDMAERIGDGIRVPLMDSMVNAEAIMAEAVARWPVLWIGPAPVRRHSAPVGSRGTWDRFSMARLEGLNAAYRDIATQAGVPYLDVIEAFRSDATWQAALAAGNGVFPTGQGHQHLAELIRRWMPWRAWMGDGLAPRRAATAAAATAPAAAPPTFAAFG